MWLRYPDTARKGTMPSTSRMGAMRFDGAPISAIQATTATAGISESTRIAMARPSHRPDSRRSRLRGASLRPKWAQARSTPASTKASASRCGQMPKA